MAWERPFFYIKKENDKKKQSIINYNYNITIIYDKYMTNIIILYEVGEKL